MKVNVLGTKYKILLRSSNEDRLLRESSGYVDRTTKTIVICDKEPDCEIENFDFHQKSVMRHEIIHAFMEESGLSGNSEHKSIGIDETMVDWMAIQFPKISKAFKKVGCN